MAVSTGGRGAVLGYLKYVLGFDSLAFEKGLGDADKRLKAAQRSMTKTADRFKSIGLTMSAALTAPLIGFGALALNEAKEAAHAMGQVTSALNSMGPAAGRTADQLKKASDALELSSLYEGDEILTKVTANLLTFGNVSGTVFDRAQQAVVNLSSRMGTDLQASTVLIGKALNAPVKGLAALSRVGIQFTESQKAQIKAMVEVGNVAGAQGIILGELERQYGGAAQAAQNTDPLNKASDAFKQMAETVGNALLPIIPVLTDAIVSVANAFSNLSPGMQKVIIIGAGLAAALGPVLLGIGGLVSVIGFLLPIIAPFIAGLTGVAAAEGVAATASFALGAAINTILLPLTAVAAAVAAVYLVWKNWDSIAPILSRLWQGAKKYIGEALFRVLEAVLKPIAAVKRAFYDLYDAVVGHSYIPDMVDGIAHHMARLDEVMVKQAQNAADKTANVFRKLRDDVAPIIDRLFPERGRQRQFVSESAKLQSLPEGERNAAMGRLGREYLKDTLGGLGKTKGDAAGVMAAMDEAAARFSSQVKEGLFGSKGAIAEGQNFWRQTVQSGFRAALDGDLGSWFESWWKDRVARGMEKALNSLADLISNLFSKVGGKGGGGGDFLSMLSNLFGGGGGGFDFGSMKAALGSFKGGLPGFAKGGVIGGFGGMDRNLLSINGSPAAWVSKGENLYIHPNKGGSNDNARSVTVNVYAKDAVLTSTVRQWVAEGVSAGVRGAAEAQALKRRQVL